MKIKEFIFNILHCVNIILHLHSKAPTEEIKNNVKIFAIGGFFVAILILFTGNQILFFSSPFKIELLDTYGAWIFFGFVLVFCIVFFDYKKCEEITKKMKQKELDRANKISKP